MLTSEQTSQLIKDVAEIKTALLGMPEHEIEGIVKKVGRHEKYIQKSKLRAGFWTGLSAGVGYVLHQVTEYFKHG